MPLNVQNWFTMYNKWAKKWLDITINGVAIR